MVVNYSAPRRVVAGSLIGFIVFAVDAAATLIRFVLNPAVAERATGGSLLAMGLFLLLFVAGGACAGYLSFIRVAPLRYLSIGALAGALVWSYLTVTWPLTARPGAFYPPQTPVADAVLIGAIGGALGGLLLWLIAGAGRLIRGRR
jgi:hypothetical protein